MTTRHPQLAIVEARLRILEQVVAVTPPADERAPPELTQVTALMRRRERLLDRWPAGEVDDSDPELAPAVARARALRDEILARDRALTEQLGVCRRRVVKAMRIKGATRQQRLSRRLGRYGGYDGGC